MQITQRANERLAAKRRASASNHIEQFECLERNRHLWMQRGGCHVPMPSQCYNEVLVGSSW